MQRSRKETSLRSTLYDNQENIQASYQGPGDLNTLGARHGITIKELAEECGVRKRTLYRHLKTLGQAGHPVLTEVAEGTTH
jgi:DNA-binding MarR family transcriptional regulator